jgi:hypothetical protein
MSNRAFERTQAITEIDGTVTAALPVSLTATPTVVPFDDTVGIVVLAANALRLGATLFNNSDGNMFLLLGSTATLALFTVRMVPNAYYEVPFNYRGAITAIWAVATTTGNAQVTELTA